MGFALSLDTDCWFAGERMGFWRIPWLLRLCVLQLWRKGLFGDYDLHAYFFAKSIVVCLLRGWSKRCPWLLDYYHHHNCIPTLASITRLDTRSPQPSPSKPSQEISIGYGLHPVRYNTVHRHRPPSQVATSLHNLHIRILLSHYCVIPPSSRVTSRVTLPCSALPLFHNVRLSLPVTRVYFLCVDVGMLRTWKKSRCRSAR